MVGECADKIRVVGDDWNDTHVLHDHTNSLSMYPPVGFWIRMVTPLMTYDEMKTSEVYGA